MDADVLVIGAGAAGLAAARALARRSFRVVILEARDRTGGRAWSASWERPGPLAELGAEFIHGPAPETRSLIHAAGLAIADVGGDGWLCDKGGDLVPEADDLRWGRRIFEDTPALPADESVAQFLQRYEKSPATCASASLARAFVENFDAADPAIASVRGIADELHSGVDDEVARPKDGYRPMFDWLRDACAAAGVQMRESMYVRTIAWQRGSVTAETIGERGKALTFTARAAIVTLPVGVLQHRGETAVTFAPALPGSKREALSKIAMGHAVKVVLRFRTAFWRHIHDGRYAGAAFFRCGDKPFPTYWTQLPLKNDLVIAWAGGPKAAVLEALSNAERIELALGGFGDLFGERERARNDFEQGLTHDWSSDQFAFGAYSYLLVGGGSARAALAAPIDSTLFFAGEATATDGQGGTVNGALHTGERAAGEVAAALGTSRDR